MVVHACNLAPGWWRNTEPWSWLASQPSLKTRWTTPEKQHPNGDLWPTNTLIHAQAKAHAQTHIHIWQTHIIHITHIYKRRLAFEILMKLWKVPGNSELNLLPIWVAPLKVSKSLFFQADQWTGCLQGLPQIEHPQAYKLQNALTSTQSEPGTTGGTPLPNLLARGTPCITGCTVKCFPTSSFFRNSTQGISLSESHSQPNCPAVTTLGRGPLNSLPLWGTGLLSELSAYKNDLLLLLLSRHSPVLLFTSTSVLFPSLKGKGRLSTKSKWRRFMKCLGYKKALLFKHRLNLRLFMLTPKRWRNVHLPNFIRTRHMSLKLVQKCS